MFVPRMYEDELLYSTIARYNIREGNLNIKLTLEELFGSRTITAIADLPSNLDELVNKIAINKNLTSEKIIYKNTLYPFYTTFLPKDRAIEIMDSMKGDAGSSIYNRTGIMASSIVQNKYFKYCPQCAKEDLKKYGELYWHRNHQIPCIHICTKHKTLLLDSEVLIHSKNKHEYIAATTNNCSVIGKRKNISESFSHKTVDRLIKLAENVDVLLNNKYPNKPLDWFCNQYGNRLKELGLANINGRVRYKELIGKFKDYYGEEFLELVQSNVDDNNESSWLRMIIRKHRKSFHPIRHLLMIDFLDMNLDELIYTKKNYQPFGEGKWPCLNPASEHYKKFVVSELEIKYSSEEKASIGTFKCECGFVYHRKGPDTKLEDIYKITRVKQYGHVWEDKLKELVKQKLALREIARRLKADPNTINRYADKLGLNAYWRIKEKSKVDYVSDDVELAIGDSSFQEKMYGKRKEWLELIKQYPDKSKTELRELNRAVYAWLYRNDRAWLNVNSPISSAKKTINKRVNWQERDEEILREVIVAIDEILKSEGKPRRLTISSIGKQIGKLSLLQKHIDKMPKTKAYIENNVESIEDYQQRRIEWAIDELKKEGNEIKEWKVIRKAGIKKGDAIMAKNI
jgi:hypothetical protein